MPSIKEKLEKSKWLLEYIQKTKVFYFVCTTLIIVVVTGAVFLVREKVGQTKHVISLIKVDLGHDLIQNGGYFVASKTGKSYYFPWCGAVKRIKSDNLIYFATEDEAMQNDYKPAGNCNGLK